MIQIIKSKKIDTIDIIDDAVCFKDLFVLRLEDKLIALSSENYEVIWETKIAGKTEINLDTIFIIKETIITFSYNREDKVCFMYGVNAKGEILWKSTSNYRPNGSNAVCKLNNKLVFNGYSVNQNSLAYRPILEVNPINGEIKEIGQNKTGNTYILNVYNNLLVCGAEGIYLFDSNLKNNPKLISDDFLVNILSSTNNESTYLAQSGARGKYNILTIDKALKSKIIGNVLLDNSDKGNMSPLLIEDKILSFAGEEKGMILKQLDSEEIIWHIGNNELSGITTEKIDENSVIIMVEDLDLNTKVNIYDLKTGDIKAKTDFKGISSSIFHFNGTILIGSSRGLHIYKWNN